MLAAVLASVALAQPTAAYPSTRLDNGSASMTVYHPDPVRGFYRGTRFDHSGVIRDVKVNGHTAFGPWKGTHDPANNDDITGPCEEFGMADPVGYAAAKPGRAFLKIGVGLLEKPAGGAKYEFYRNYRVKQFAPWTTSPGPDRVTFTQSARLGGTAYEYTKVVELLPNKAGFRIRHRLVNTGTERISTDVYNHNFFNVDGDPVGPNYAVEFGRPVRAAKPEDRFNELARLDNGTLRFTKVLAKGSAYSPIEGLPPADTYTFALTHAPSRLRLAVRGTGARLLKVNLWAVGGCVCPEPFVAVDVSPGRAQEWAAEYEFGAGW